MPSRELPSVGVLRRAFPCGQELLQEQQVPPAVCRLQYRVGLSPEDAEDIVREQLVEALEPGAPLFKGLQDKDPAPPRFRIACYRRGLDHRRRQRAVEDSEALIENRPGAVTGTQPGEGPAEKWEQVLDSIPYASDCFDRLSDRQRQVIILRIFHGMSFDEIAHALGVRLGTVTNHYSEGMHRLRACLEGKRAEFPQQFELLDRLRGGDGA